MRGRVELAVHEAGDEAAEAAYWLGRTLLKQKKPADAFALLDPAVGKFKTGEFAPYLVVARIDAMYEIPERRKETVALYGQFIGQHADHPLAPQARYMAALAALENALGVPVSDRTRALRGLLLRGAAIESHALHVFALALPRAPGAAGVAVAGYLAALAFNA
mgnify:CR=1 FL=1